MEATEIRHIGKESNRLDEVAEGLITDPNEVYIEYRDERREWARQLLSVSELRDELGISEFSRQTGLSPRAVRYALRGRRLPHPRARERIKRLLIESTAGDQRAP